MSRWADLQTGTRFCLALPGFLRHPVSPEEARLALEARLANRARDFVALVERTVFAERRTPYQVLLRHVGCEAGDLRALVGREGVEGALHALYRAGVYLTVEEFKGREPVRRGSLAFRVDPRDLRNPGSNVHLPSRTSGSRGLGSPVPFDLAAVRDWAVNKSLAYAARGGATWRHARWSVPGGATIVQLLLYAAFGATPVRWFSQVDPGAAGLDAAYLWSARALRWGSRLAGVRLPRPEHVPLDAPEPVAAWMAGLLRVGHTPHLATYASSAVRVCQAARRAGLDLAGAQFSVGGEPVTVARLAAIRAVGAEAAPRYGSIEAGLIADGCLTPATADDLHLYHDLSAFVQPGPEAARPGAPEDAVLVSSLRPSAPLVLLNVSLGDRATLAERACGCPLERLGWTTHLQDVRSYEKLTAGGMTFLDTDVARALEEVLPARFGGGPTHYQLVEDDAPDGMPRLRLLVDPVVAPADEVAIREAFLDAIGGGGGPQAVMGRAWRDGAWIRVERRSPLTTAAGKILHVQARERRGAVRATS
jgi:hypothetical protein